VLFYTSYYTLSNTSQPFTNCRGPCTCTAVSFHYCSLFYFHNIFQTTGVYCLNSMTKPQITSPIQHFSLVHKTTRYLIWHELYYNKASRGIIVCIPHFPLVRQTTGYLVQTQHPTAFNPVEQEGHCQAPSSSQTSPQT